MTKPKIEIDANSGFCFGVVTAIQKAEAELARTGSLMCLGDIVHNASEVERLCRMGLSTITHADLPKLYDTTVLLRAHGEPPSTYETLSKNNITVIDATCPVVLRLQRRIKEAYDMARKELYEGKREVMPLFVIYGKNGHAEVNGLVGQTNGEAVVIQEPQQLDALDFNRDIFLYSQTTMSLEGFRNVVDAIKYRLQNGRFEYSDTICRQVATRSAKIRDFAKSHDVIVFVTGAKSSNGKVLLEECRAANPNTHAVTDANGVDASWFPGAGSIGICGATSTPAWLMKDVASKIDMITETTIYTRNPEHE